MNTAEFSKSIIALACWRAAKTELHPTMLSVCMVFKNRADAGWNDGDLYENCADWLKANPGDMPDVRDPQFQKLLEKLEGVTSGMVPDKTGGALYFAPKSAEKIDGTLTATIGQMFFYR